jgi:hypothetical protein
MAGRTEGFQDFSPSRPPLPEQNKKEMSKIAREGRGRGMMETLTKIILFLNSPNNFHNEKN